MSAAQSTKKLTWLIFILAKIKILSCAGDDITEMAFLLFACLYNAIIFLPAHVQCDLLECKAKFYLLFYRAFI